MTSVKFEPIKDIVYAIETLEKLGYNIQGLSSTGAIQFDEDIQSQQIEQIQLALDNLPDINITDIRNERNQLLIMSDWTQLLDSPMDEIIQKEWQVYRQQLRDFPEKVLLYTKDQKIVWPIPPEDNK
jgi:hypothetical protein